MSSESTPQGLDYSTIIDRLGEGLLIFETDGRLVLDNAAARQILGANLAVIRLQGWPAFAVLVDSSRTEKADDIRAKALRQTDPVRFHMMLSDAYIPCWASGVHQENGQTLTLISIERPDWKPLIELMESFRKEALPAIDDARGHAGFIIKIAKQPKDNMTADQLAQRVIGFGELISTQMSHLQVLITQLERLEHIRTGELESLIKKSTKKVNLQDFIEDFIEEFADAYSKEIGKAGEDIRDRISTDISSDLAVQASPKYLHFILQDVLQNALMYSKPKTPIQLRAFATNQSRHIQLDIIDQGYGIRESEYDRVFAPFQRARQPQVIAEFGYGLSLALAKANIEVMGGRIWFSSDEGVGTTFSLKLPAYQEKSES